MTQARRVGAGTVGSSKRQHRWLLFLLAMWITVCGCATRRGPYTPLAEGSRDSNRAQQLTRDAVKIIECDPERAERLLRDALGNDLYHGPAHNNLGVLYMTQGKLYEAAAEFEWARKLMPGHPDPRVNLALVLEHAGRSEDAIAAYASALEVYPGHIGAMQGLARLRMRTGRADGQTAKLLEDIAIRGEDERWRNWARMQQPKLVPLAGP